MGGQFIVWIILLVIGLWVLYYIFNMQHPRKLPKMNLTAAWWNYAPDYPVHDTYIFVDEIHPALHVNSHVVLHNVTTTCPQLPTDQIINDLTAAAFHVTAVDKANKYFKVVLGPNFGVEYIDPATFQCYASGVITILN